MCIISLIHSFRQIERNSKPKNKTAETNNDASIIFATYVSSFLG